MHAFFSFITSSLIDTEGETVSVRGLGGVAIMLQQIYREYSSLPPFREITLQEIEFFYDGLRSELVKLNRGR